ncbi:hypothetical protein D8B26_006739 [Coccidioides posadasii str. Silveira]|uniref:AB hydrolase-1 domain-containing protein n=1 Tax=Coccidioides posadasii (strain RMSCC 757 / Silveira) TaxID=443226 RepID=E9CRG0_COCPS|nr:conserved hypothetical protein [Coccidioides posadasii str. Silveira]QVM12103.1 hypothetical protein D8B26_006739 [Coccidioides posadasii str. Silveira]
MAATTFPFRVVEHVTPCQHIREYPRATSTTQEETLHLSVKQYIPLDNPSPQPGDVTIIGAHANGFPKELYEPLWEELLARSKSNGFRIRAIWIADAAHQGNSSVLNEHAMGNDPSWFDHPRDLLHLINLKREEMPRPIVGIGHSMGGGHLVALSTIHPRLFTTIILMDPAIQNLKSYISDHTFHTKGTNIPTTTRASTYRRDLWPSRSAAAEILRKSKFYQSWDQRVFDRWIKYGLRELPTAIHPLDSQSQTLPPGQRPVTLTTTLHQEVFTFSRPKYSIANSDRETQRLTHPDISLDVPNSHLFYRPESPRMFTFLRYLRPSVFYIFGEKSDMSKPEFCQEKLETTGVGVGGSGGAKEGRVDAYTLKKVGHLIPMEAVKDSAELSATWLGKELERWRREEEILWKQWEGKSKVERMTIDDEWKKHIGPPPLRNGNNKTEKRAPKL